LSCVCWWFNFVGSYAEKCITVLPLKEGVPTPEPVPSKHKLFEPHTKAAVAIKGNFLFLIGGTYEEIAKESMYRFDAVSGTWIVLSPMTEGRFDHTASVMGDYILVIGGRQLSEGYVLSYVENYDIKANKWRKMRDYPKKVCNAAACEVNGNVYISGG